MLGSRAGRKLLMPAPMQVQVQVQVQVVVVVVVQAVVVVRVRAAPPWSAASAHRRRHRRSLQAQGRWPGWRMQAAASMRGPRRYRGIASWQRRLCDAGCHSA